MSTPLAHALTHLYQQHVPKEYTVFKIKIKLYKFATKSITGFITKTQRNYFQK